jgi:hypothetical protein
MSPFTVTNAQQLICPQCGKPTAVLIAHLVGDRATGHYSCLVCARSLCPQCVALAKFSTDDYVGELTGTITLH